MQIPNTLQATSQTASPALATAPTQQNGPKSPAGAVPSLPSGWKHINAQTPQNGYKLATSSHTAFVKPAQDGGYHLVLLRKDMGDADLHPTVLSNAHEAFALAHAKLGRMAMPDSSPAEWDGQGSPPGYAPVGGVSYLHQKTVGNKTAFVSQLGGHGVGVPTYSASGYGPGGDELSHQVHATPQAAHAAAEAYLTSGSQKSGSQNFQNSLNLKSGSLEALAGKTSVEGGESKTSSKWGNSPFAQYAKKVDGLSSADARAHFAQLYEGHDHVYHDLSSPIQKWTSSSSGHAWQTHWPAALDGQASPGALKVQEALQTRRDRWQKLSETHGVPFPETFHVHRGVSDSDGTILPHIIAAWRNEAEPYMRIKSHPAASWSLSKESAKGFYGGDNGALFETHIPFEQTLADKYVDDQSLLHSFKHENEVVAGGQKDAIIAPKAGVTAKYKGTEYSYADRHKLFDTWAKDHGGKLPDPKHFGIDIKEHQKKVGTQVQLKEVVLGRTVMSDDKPEFKNIDYKKMTGAEYMAHINEKVKAFQAPLIEAGVTPAPLDGTVKPIGSFADARAEKAAERMAAEKGED